jgi:serine/threonine protein kinase
MILDTEQAAQMLTGTTLNDGWLVGKKIDDADSDKGGVYSCCYEVTNGNRKGFLKAFDYSGAEKAGVGDPVEYMKNLLTAFTLERHILEKCTNAQCKNVVELLDHGGLTVENAKKYPRVEYLILEYAEKGDVKEVLKQEGLKMEFKLRSLHQLCKGLSQIHRLDIAHQDIKPQNVVLNKNITKLSDFGSAIPLKTSQQDLPNHLRKDYTGTWAYAPPELLYGEINGNTTICRIGCDLYLLGSMIVYYFTNTTMTALIRKHLTPELCWTNQIGTYGRYRELMPHLTQAFEDALEQVRNDINDPEVEENLILIIRYLCNPDPERRGHKKNIEQAGPNFDLNRFITMLDVLATHYSIRNK